MVGWEDYKDGNGAGDVVPSPIPIFKIYTHTHTHRVLRNNTHTHTHRIFAGLRVLFGFI